MVNLDANLLIAAGDSENLHFETARKVLAVPGPFRTSAVAWTEYLSRPVPPVVLEAMLAMMVGGILSFDSAVASLAGRLFHATGSKRRTRLDTMIAATVIFHDDELATTNPDDFKPFVAHGLKLFPMPEAGA